MNSQSLYNYSKAKQHQPGFLVMAGNQPKVLYEYHNFNDQTDMLSFFCAVQSVGRYRCDQTSLLSRNLISSFDLIYVYEGCLEVQFGGNDRLFVCANEVFIAGGMDAYRVRSCEGKDAEFLLLSHCGTISEKYYELICKSNTVNNLSVLKGTFEDLLEDLIFYVKYPFQMNPFFAVNTLMQILMQVYFCALDPGIYTMRGQPKWLLSSLKYMDSHYCKRMTVDDIAGKCGLSTSHFHKLFRENTGMSPYQYLMKLRIANAKTYLKNGDKSVKCIAYTVGFPSVNHFIDYFRKETGITPQTYRQQYRCINLQAR